MGFLIPLKSKSDSSSYKDNFLYQQENIFVMDNHRLALWCWFQSIKSGQSYNLIHVDAHPDMSGKGLSEFQTKYSKNLPQMSLEDYREIKQDEFNIPLFRWDNYLEFFVKEYGQYIDKFQSYSMTHKMGGMQKLNYDVLPHECLKTINEIFIHKKIYNQKKWIVNVDIDYFFSSLPEKEVLFHSDLISKFALAIKQGLQENEIQVLTIALSPECCGGWKKAESVFEIFREVLGLKCHLNEIIEA